MWDCIYIFCLAAIVLSTVLQVNSAPWITEKKIPFSDPAVSGATEHGAEFEGKTWSTILKHQEPSSPVCPPLMSLKNFCAYPLSFTLNCKRIL